MPFRSLLAQATKMVPIATADLVNDNGELPSTDPGASVFPAVDADNRLKKLWSQHGDIRSSTLV